MLTLKQAMQALIEGKCINAIDDPINYAKLVGEEIRLFRRDNNQPDINFTYTLGNSDCFIVHTPVVLFSDLEIGDHFTIEGLEDKCVRQKMVDTKIFNSIICNAIIKADDGYSYGFSNVLPDTKVLRSGRYGQKT